MTYSLNLHGRLLDLSTPRVMGILNVTPDSFFAASRSETEQQIARRTEQLIAQGAAIIDVGACSTRPGSQPVSEEEEMARLRMALPIIRKTIDEPTRQSNPISHFSPHSSPLSPHSSHLSPLSSHLSPLPSPLSVDTFRPAVARMAVEEFGADIINDVSEGSDELFRMVARLGVPYVLMSVQADLRQTLLTFARKVQQLRDCGQKDIILDPGFGFGKTLDENFALFGEMDKLQVLGLPLLVGISRKSMICRTLGCTPEEALNGTTVLNTLALSKGASILRVHDVREATEAVTLYAKTLHHPPV